MECGKGHCLRAEEQTSFLSTFFFVFVVLIGTFFTMNLLIATIVEAFQVASLEDKREE